MASVCEICNKKPSFGMSVSHSHRRTRRRWNIDVCTGCLKAGKVTKPPARNWQPESA